MFNAAQALEFRRPLKSSEFIEETLQSIFSDTSNYGMIYKEIKEGIIDVETELERSLKSIGNPNN